MFGKKLLAAGAAVGAGLGVAATADEARAEWQPTKPIEFVIQTSPGGGSDQYARFWIGIIEKYDLSPQPVIPVNKPGGAGAVALTDLYSRAGDAHFISPTLNSIITTPLLQEIPVMYPSEDLTPVVKMMMDPFLLVVNPDSFQNAEEFMAACRERRLTAVGTGSKQEDEIHINLVQHAMGCEPFRYVPAAGGGDVAAAVAGGHADFNVNQPSEMLPHYPERLIPIMSFQRERPEQFPEAATHWELGLDGEYGELLDIETGLHQMRGIMAAPNIPEEAVRWYEDLFRQVFETPEWQEFMQTGAMTPVFMTSEEYKDFLTRFEDNHVKVMRDVVGWELRPDLRERDGS